MEHIDSIRWNKTVNIYNRFNFFIQIYLYKASPVYNYLKVGLSYSCNLIWLIKNPAILSINGKVYIKNRIVYSLHDFSHYKDKMADTRWIEGTSSKAFISCSIMPLILSHQEFEAILSVKNHLYIPLSTLIDLRDL